MIRVQSLDDALTFFCDKLGLIEGHRMENEAGRFSLVYLYATDDIDYVKAHTAPLIELTYNWDQQSYTEGGNFGHLAFEVEDIYAYCQSLMEQGIVINRPPRDGYMAFIRSPDNISIELLQKGEKRPLKEPWVSMENQGTW
jgi:lactoylglutathione lyase